MGVFKLWSENNNQQKLQSYKRLWNDTLRTLVGGQDAKDVMSQSLSKLVKGDKSDPQVTYRGPNAVKEMLSGIFNQMRKIGQEIGQDPETGLDLNSNADETLRWLNQSGENKDGKSAMRPVTLGDLLQKMFGQKLVAQFTGNETTVEPKEPDMAKPQVPPQPPENNTPPQEPTQDPTQTPEMPQPQDPGLPQPQNPLANSQLKPTALHNAHTITSGGVFSEWVQKRNK